MKISQCMSPDVETVTPEQTIREAARFMLREDAGSMPVCDGDRLVGMITDRDITVRAVAEGRGPDTPVRDAMTDEILYCFDDDDIEAVALKMSDAQVRRFPVISREEKKLVGIISLGDISRGGQHEPAHIAMEGVTDPGGLHNQSADAE